MISNMRKDSKKSSKFCGECGIVYTSEKFLQKYIDQCPICKSRRYEKVEIKTSNE